MTNITSEEKDIAIKAFEQFAESFHHFLEHIEFYRLLFWKNGSNRQHVLDIFLGIDKETMEDKNSKVIASLFSSYKTWLMCVFWSNDEHAGWVTC